MEASRTGPNRAEPGRKPTGFLAGSAGEYREQNVWFAKIKNLRVRFSRTIGGHVSYECRSELSPSAVQITTQDQSPISKGSDILQSPSVQIYISDRDRFLYARDFPLRPIHE